MFRTALEKTVVNEGFFKGRSFLDQLTDCPDLPQV
jgi:hypothetical protein